MSDKKGHEFGLTGKVCARGDRYVAIIELETPDGRVTRKEVADGAASLEEAKRIVDVAMQALRTAYESSGAVLLAASEKAQEA